MFCKHCKADKSKGLFYVSNQTKCKECVKNSVKKHRQENLEHVRSYDRMRGSMPHRVSARLEYQKTQAFTQSHKAAAQRWTAKHPERRQANILVGNAVRDGRLAPLPCLVCGTEKTEGHHPDYSRPLDVVWLCVPHHKEVHEMASA